MNKMRVLIMDDEDIVLDVVTSMLEFMGYEAEVSRTADEALEKYRAAASEGKPFDAVILDLSIPGSRGGKEVIHDLAAIDPGVCALVSSGYSNDPVMTNYTEYGFKGVVKKPFKMEDLRDALKKATGS
ncbi:MAG TPA: response regulator [Deltaproteobacteria bacterium]|nr:response regulator [Deltaproteobacteria bacterium]HOM28512.1 response regulator [Deltaproteobacteria bacterium]HPP79706.1 response regulator [Deltaproteobacteria bacterium]